MRLKRLWQGLMNHIKGILFCFVSVFPPKGDGDLLEELQQRTDLIKSTLKKIAQAAV